MDNQRLFLFVALSLVLMFLWQAWEGNKRKDAVVSSAPTTAASSTATEPTPLSSTPSTNNVAASTAATASASQQPIPVAALALKSAQRVHVVSDLFIAEIDTAGGDLRRLDLTKYPVATDKPNEPFQLFNDTLPNLFIAQTGVVGSSSPAPDSDALFSSDNTEYRLADGTDSIDVRLNWTHPDGVTVVKTYTFHRNSYLVDVKVDVSNNSAKEWKGRVYRQLQRTKVGEVGQSSFVNTYMGGVVSSERNKYDKVKFENMAEWKPQDSFYKGGWAAMLQHYFFGAWIPPQDQANHYYTNVLDQTRYIIGMMTEELAIAPGASTTQTARLYAGPKDQHHLKDVAPNLELVVDYGVLTIIAQPLFWLLDFFYRMIGNWGWAIVCLTIVIKLMFYKLSQTSYKSMAHMRRVQPKMQALRERYADDKQRMSQGLMELYKKEKINPLGGCLPMVVQIPVFIALYWVLLESVELRQADFIFWIHDLASKDPFYVLPVLMGASMFIQQKLNPPVPDPIQQKVMMALPFVFLFFFAFFPSGLVLYWVVNNVLSIAQQWYITRSIERAASA